MQASTDEYWMNYLRDPSAAIERRLIQNDAIRKHAQRTLLLNKKEQDELQNIILFCSKETRLWLCPLFDIPSATQLLYYTYKELEKGEYAGKSPKERRECFARKLEEDEELRRRIGVLLDAAQSSAEGLKATLEATAAVAATPVSVEGVREQERRRKLRTWRDLPQEELAERLSRGEIISRDEWVPGLSKGRRKLSAKDLQAHLEFGKQIHREGNEAFSKEDYQLALTRFTQGVNLLNWVEGEDEEGTYQVDDLLLTFLKNEAGAALKLGHYQTAISACNSALQLDAEDAKALFRRAVAFLHLGDMVSAKNDYLKILKSEYTSTESKMAAREGLKRMRDVVSSWKSDIRQLMLDAATQSTFSDRREEDSVKRSTLPAGPVPRRVLSTKPRSTRSPIATILGLAEGQETGFSTSQHISKDAIVELLEEILLLYTAQETQATLKRLRGEAELSEGKFLIKARRVVPQLLEPLLEGLDGSTPEERTLKFHNSLEYYYSVLKDNDICSLVKDVHECFIGDCIEDEEEIASSIE